jgi:pyruvate dehydrogenase E2 component (dihydrolipoamide acetyltransferase)
MTTAVIMPQGGQDIESGTVVQWLKKEGDPVRKGEVICEVETEKVVLEVEAPADGFLRKIVASQGAEVPILSVIGIIGELDEVISLDAIQPEVEKGKSAETTAIHAGREMTRGRGEGKILISPRAKKLALEKGGPIDQIRGSGPRGRIMEKDVQAFLAGQTADQATTAVGQRTSGRVVPMSKARKVIARKMQLSKQTIPHFYVSISVDMTDALALQRELNEGLERADEKYWSLTDLITKACVVSLKEVPELNCSLADQGNMILWENVNIGIAVAHDTGIVVPGECRPYEPHTDRSANAPPGRLSQRRQGDDFVS